MFLFLWGAATATLESFDYHKCEDGSYTINSLPFELGTRTNFESGKHLFIRPCYHDMAEVFFKSMSATRPYVVVPFIGTAGIGKSCLFLFILMEWFEREGQPQSFYYQTAKDEISVFEATFDGKFQVSTVPAAGARLNANMPMFVDMKEQSLPEDHSKTFIFSSFQPKRYKEITKGMPQYVMPTWTVQEYADYFALDHFWTDRGFDRALHYELVQQSVVMYGGSLRNVVVAVQHVLDENNDSLDAEVKAALQSKGASTAECVFEGGFNANDEDISDVLIHRNPPVDENGDYLYARRKVVHTVASLYVFDELLSTRKTISLARYKEKFNNTLIGGSEDGKLFEHLCLSVIPFLGRSFEMVLLSDSNTKQKITVPATKQILTANWRNEELNENVLYVPSHGSMESGDAFCLLNVQGVRCVIVFQMTIAEDHPVKMRGLRVISGRFADVGRQYLVFVTPMNGKLCEPQNLLTTDKKVAKNFNGVEGFRDFQYKMEMKMETEVCVTR